MFYRKQSNQPDRWGSAVTKARLYIHANRCEAISHLFFFGIIFDSVCMSSSESNSRRTSGTEKNAYEIDKSDKIIKKKHDHGLVASLRQDCFDCVIQSLEITVLVLRSTLLVQHSKYDLPLAIWPCYDFIYLLYAFSVSFCNKMKFFRSFRASGFYRLQHNCIIEYIFCFNFVLH